MAGEHPAPRGACVRGLAHRPPVGADGSALLPEVCGQGTRLGLGGHGGFGEQGPGNVGHHLAEARGWWRLPWDVGTEVLWDGEEGLL